MMNNCENLDHEEFKELCALANSGTLSPEEWLRLDRHLQKCQQCREAYSQYRVLIREGFPVLGARYGHPKEEENWDDTATREKLFACVQAAEQYSSLEATGAFLPPEKLGFLQQVRVNPLTLAALAACLVAVAGLEAYRLGSRVPTGEKQAQVLSEGRFQKLTAEKQSVDKLLDAQTKKLSQLLEEHAQSERELAGLRSALRTLEDHSNKLVTANSTTEEQLRTVSQQRDTLSSQLRRAEQAEQAYQTVQSEVARLKVESAKVLQRTTSLESQINELTAVNQDQERKLREDEQYLAFDRDIRELMGARNLYIADVFDVDSSSHTRKPFGRVFYTQGKSLIFYAFDLDRQPGLKNANTFQAWGRKETASGGQTQTKNLGILFMDSESSRRWVLRCDDPGKLDEIDAIFVTVEPHGGSQKPTAKPFLYALLRKEANHP